MRSIRQPWGRRVGVLNIKCRRPTILQATRHAMEGRARSSRIGRGGLVALITTTADTLGVVTTTAMPITT